ncbi:potassium/proton antiporter [Evtepia sp.]|uniref:potassium/proton antiporter n=1 Tax=Evtepia sp. TaxID=2773933 RepID=UPI002A818B9D|nr:potassium/proton antiporter [Evtepia sp.]MDY4429552.1 potassium/proton antiporter [Evtepia sp.]
MTQFLLMSAIVIFACVLCNKASSRLGVPTLLAFILLGMFFGSDGVVKIPFDNYAMAEDICSLALIFIMFYGGFGTNWQEARPVAGKAVLLSSLGTVLTAGLVGLFSWKVLGLPQLEGFLLGAVISSTDAASVFSILRSKNLGLRENTASLLEVESGSNDPFSYMLTVIVLSLMTGRAQGSAFAWQVFAQLFFGAAFGVGIALVSQVFLRRFRFASEGFDAIFMVAVALAAYAAPTLLGGNGYLSVYLTGILLGNQPLRSKQALVNFFDGATGLMQMVLFFLLGLLSFPSQLPAVAPTALAVALFLTFLARPIAVTLILGPFRSSLGQILLVSWSGMRGAASIVFSILAVTSPAVTDLDLYHIVFFIVLFSILVQGSLIPLVARKVKMTDGETDVMKTFNDYTDQVPVQFLQCTLTPGHPWAGKAIRDLDLPPACLLVLVTRQGEKLVPNGATVLEPGDQLVLSGRAGGELEGVCLYEKTIKKRDPWLHRPLSDLDTGEGLIILIRRAGDVVIPQGSTVLQEGDVLLISGQ